LGGHGFIGRHVCLELASLGFRVVAIGHGTWSAKEWPEWGVSEWFRGDIDSATLRRALDGRVAELFIHCAGSATVSHSYAAPLDDYQRSVATTANLLEFMRASCREPARLVLASSAAVYGDHGAVDLDESALCMPISPYGHHKLIAEKLCESYARFFGLRISVVRLFSVYGEGLRKQLLWDAANKFASGQATFLGSGHELRDWLHVSDAARLLCAAATATGQADFAVYNGGGSQATTGTVVAELGGSLPSPVKGVFNGAAHPGNPSRLTADCSRAHSELSWHPEIDVTEGVRRYAQWFRMLADGKK
jgi:UDP-glucose 4-epimerase